MEMALGVRARRKEEEASGSGKTKPKVDDPLLGLSRASAAPRAHFLFAGAHVLRDVRDILGDTGGLKAGLAAKNNNARVRPEGEVA